MGKWVKRIVLCVLAAVFLVSGGVVLYKWYLDRQTAREYEAAADQFAVPRRPDAPPSDGPEDPPREEGIEPPLEVDFDALRAINEDIVGWIYCEDTAINYPLLRGETNDEYLRHLYDRSYSVAGSIFMEAENRPDLSDVNTIIYGHYMNNGTMFGGLSNWKEQSYYEEHPVMWLLTPERDYRIDIVASYYTSAYSDTYLLFHEPGAEFDEYLARALAQSVIHTRAEAEEDAHYVLLSTCAYLFDNARFVIHGKLVPADRASGDPAGA